jgi:hypothetical protein
MHVIRSVGFGIVILAGTLHSSAEQAPVTPITPLRTGGLMTRAGVNPTLASVRPDAFGTIQGNALNSTNSQLANATVRLRDARFGRIIGSQMTDQSGLFAFKSLDPGSYIVEMMGNDETILAASQVLNINAGEAVSAVVKLPFRIPPFAHVLGSATPTTASAVVAQAAATSLLAVSTVGEPTCSQ